jgi:intracellular septation protein A
MATTGIQVPGSGLDRSRLRALAPTAVFDIAGPLAVYWLLRAAGTAEVTGLIVSGVMPTLGVAIGIIRHRRVDAIGSLVLAGIIVGTVAGLLTHSARLVLMEGSIPTAVFALACLGSLLTARPLMYRIALQARGASTAARRDLQARWTQPSAQHTFRTITLVWGIALAAEAATRVLIVETISTDTALLVIKLMPYIVIAGLFRWMAGYIRRVRRQAEQRPVVLSAASVATAGPDPAPVQL